MGLKDWLTRTGLRRGASVATGTPSWTPPPPSPPPPPPPPPTDDPPPPPTDDVVILEGNEILGAVGESHYQDALARLCGGRTTDGHFLDVIAILVPEPQNQYDPNAVAVVVGGLHVGYLSRELAARCHEPIARRMQAEGRAVGCRAQIRGGWNRGGGDVGSFGIELYFSPRRIDREQIAPVSLTPDAEAAVVGARQGVGRRTPPGSAPDGKFKGRHYTEYVEEVKDLKREDPLDDLIELLQRLVDATEDESAQEGFGVAPWYFEQLAVAYHKRKDYASEVAILERFASLPHAPGASPPQLLERLEKARALLNADVGRES